MLAKERGQKTGYLANWATKGTHEYSRSLISPVVIISNLLELLGQSKQGKDMLKLGLEPVRSILFKVKPKRTVYW